MIGVAINERFCNWIDILSWKKKVLIKFLIIIVLCPCLFSKIVLTFFTIKVINAMSLRRCFWRFQGQLSPAVWAFQNIFDHLFILLQPVRFIEKFVGWTSKMWLEIEVLVPIIRSFEFETNFCRRKRVQDAADLIKGFRSADQAGTKISSHE